MDRSDSGVQPLSLMIAEKPQATIFRGWRRFPLSASVCANCGYTELYAMDPVGVREAQERAQAGSVPSAVAIGQEGAPASSRVFLLLALGLALMAGLGVMLLLVVFSR
jgi:hypothetical protein